MYMSPSIPVSYPCHSYSGHTSLSDMFLQFLIGKSKKLHITGENKKPNVTVLYRILLYCAVLYCALLYCTLSILFYCTALYYYYNALYCTVL